MDFVASAANIRANIFGIPLKSRFDIKCKCNYLSVSVFVCLLIFIQTSNFRVNILHCVCSIMDLTFCRQ